MATKTYLTKQDIDSCYTKARFRGKGAFGNVNVHKIKPELENTELRKSVVVKSIDEINSHGADREINNLKKLANQPYIVQLLGYERYPFQIYMECLNIDLGNFVKQRKFSLTRNDIFKIHEDILRGLKCLEDAGILHRDIKPANILVDYSGSDGSNIEELRFKIGDFGCCRPVNKEKLKRGDFPDITKNLGTPGFMAPEITSLEGDDDRVGQYGSGVDIWGAAATIIYVASGGMKPFTQEFLKELRFDVNTDARRDAEILSKVRECVKDEAICSILVESLKWNPLQRKTADQSIALIDYLRKHEVATSEKKPEPVNIREVLPDIHKTDLNDGEKLKELSADEVQNLWLQPRDVLIPKMMRTGSFPPDALRKLSELLLEGKHFQDRKKHRNMQYNEKKHKNMNEENYWDQLGILLDEWVRRYPNEAKMKILTTALNKSGLPHLGKQLEKTKLLNSRKTKLPDTFLDTIKAFKKHVKREKTIITQLLPYGALEEIFESKIKRDKDITKLHIQREYKNLVDDSMVKDIEVLLAENNNVSMVRAPAGMGKTTFFNYCMVAWARGELMSMFDMMIAFSCRDITYGVVGTVNEVVFECSIIGDSGVEEAKTFSLDQMKMLAKENRLVSLVDGADEIAIPDDPRIIKEIILKVRKAMEDPNSIKLNGQEIIVGFLCGVFLSGCQLIITGRNSSINNINETFFQKIIPSQEIRIDENGVVVLKEEKTSMSSNFEICELEDQDLRSLAHNLLCIEDHSHVDDENYICFQVYEKIISIEVMTSFRKIPCFAKWLIELINFFVVHDEVYNLDLKNVTTVIVNLIFGRLREHSGMTYKDVEGFCQLLEKPTTRGLGEGVQALTRISFMEIMNNQITIEGVIEHRNGVDYINIGEESIEIEALKKMELMKISKGVHRKVLLTAEHLTLLEILCASHFCHLPIEKWQSIIQDMPKERMLMVLRFSAGLLTNANNDLVHDFMKLVSDGSYEAEEKIQELYRLVLTTDEEIIPSTSLYDYESIIFKYGRSQNSISGKRLSLLNLLIQESGVKINKDIFWNNVPKETRVEGDALTMSVEFPCGKTRNSAQLTVSMEGTTYLRSASHYKSLLFLETVTTSQVNYNIEWLSCRSHLPQDIPPSAMSGVISGTQLFVLFKYKGDVAGLLEVAATCKPNSHKSMQEIKLYNTDITAVPANILAAVFTSYGRVLLNHVSVPGDVWNLMAAGHSREGLGRMEELELWGVDLRTAPEEALAWILASMKTVTLGSTTLSDGLLTTWADVMEENFKNNEAVTEVLEVHSSVEAAAEVVDRIKSYLKPSWITKKINAVTAFFKR